MKHHAVTVSSDQPVLAAWGAGVDSTAMLIEMIERNERINHVLFADVGNENPKTYEFLPIFRDYLSMHDIPLSIVKYNPQNFKHYPPYSTLEENCLTNGTLPSKAFGRGTCSLKWKAAPQDKWTSNWKPAQDAWAKNIRVVKLIGYDCSPSDLKRYAVAQDFENRKKYEYRYPLREWGWTRADCEDRIARAGLIVPPKSSCFFCPAMKPHELHGLPANLLRRIILMEARAAPRLTKIDGLWRKPVLGQRGATPRPGSMTEYIRTQGLLPASEIDEIAANAPQQLMRFQHAHAQTPISERPAITSWLSYFDALNRVD